VISSFLPHSTHICLVIIYHEATGIKISGLANSDYSGKEKNMKRKIMLETLPCPVRRVSPHKLRGILVPGKVQRRDDPGRKPPDPAEKTMNLYRMKLYQALGGDMKKATAI
jgi:hypothetical protein